MNIIAAFLLAAQEPTAAVTAAALRDSLAGSPAVVETVRAFTALGGRIPGTSADRAARAWLINRLQQIGVDTVWEQAVPVAMWSRGRDAARLAGGGRARFTIAAFGFSPATPDSGLTARVVRFPTSAAIVAAPAESLRGNIVFLDRRMVRAQDGRGYVAAVQQRPEAIAHAVRSGAAAMLVRSTGTSRGATPHVSNLASGAQAPRIPVAAIANPDADRLAAQLARDGASRLHLTIGGRDEPPGASANIIADIRGTESPGEVVLLGAHHDSWDLGTGAVDDGAGVAIVLEVARRIIATGQRPRRTLRLVFWAAEEQGLAGARVYARGLADPASHVLALEPDQGTGAPYRLRAQGGAAGLLGQIGELVLPLGVDQLGDPPVAGPDLIPLRERGVPTMDVAQDMTELWDAAHSANDTMDRIRPAALQAAAAVYGVVAWMAANWPGTLR